MPKLDRREILQAGAVLAVPLSAVSATGVTRDDEDKKNDITKLQYLEIVTAEPEALCKQYAACHGITFGKPEPNLGNARVAELAGGSKIAIRGPLREGEAPVIRPYMLVEDLEKAVAAAKKAGAEIAIERMPIPGHGTIAIAIEGGIECGFWQQP